MARMSHGERTRQEILSAAVQLGAREGLEGLTIGRLSKSVEMSKGGLFAHFGSKEALQLATVDAAFEAFFTEVAVPAMDAGAGLPRLRSLLEGYIAYVERRSQSGGCFFTAAVTEMDDRPGPVRDRIREILEQRTELIRTCIEDAIAARQLSRRVDPAQLAFEVTALAAGANLEMQLYARPESLQRVRTALSRWVKQFELKAGGARPTKSRLRSRSQCPPR